MVDWLLHPRRRHLIDAAVLAWVIAWALLGWTAGRALDKVSEVTGSAEGAGAAVVRTGESIRDVDVPVVGTVFKEAGDEVIAAGEAAEAQARDSGNSVRKASIALGLAIWIVPTLPLLILYAPARVVRGRETRALRRLVLDHPDDADLDRLLAARAVAHLPYRTLRRLGAPWAEGDDRVLADAELAREGLTR